MALDSPTLTSSSGTRASLFRAVAPHPRDVLPFRGSSGTRASLLGAAPGPPQRRASLLGFTRETCFPFFFESQKVSGKGSTSPGSGANARKREARVPDEEEGVGESRAMSPQRDQLDPSSSCFPFQEIPSHPSDVQPFCSTPAPRASLLHAGFGRI